MGKSSEMGECWHGGGTKEEMGGGVRTGWPVELIGAPFRSK